MNNMRRPFLSCRVLDSHAGVCMGGVSRQFEQGCRLMACLIDVTRRIQAAHPCKRVSGQGVWVVPWPPNYRRHKGVRGKVICCLLRSSTFPVQISFHPKAFALHPTVPFAPLTPPTRTMITQWTKSSVDRKAFDELRLKAVILKVADAMR